MTEQEQLQRALEFIRKIAEQGVPDWKEPGISDRISIMRMMNEEYRFMAREFLKEIGK